MKVGIRISAPPARISSLSIQAFAEEHPTRPSAPLQSARNPTAK